MMFKIKYIIYIYIYIYIITLQYCAIMPIDYALFVDKIYSKNM